MPPGHLVAIGCLLLNALRRGRGLKPEGLALLAGRSTAQIRAWEYDEEPIWPTLVELCVTHMKYKVWEVEELYDCFSRIHGLSGRDSTHLAGSLSPILLTDDELQAVRRLAAPFGRMAQDAYTEAALRELRADKVRKARQEADALCTAFFAQAPERRSVISLGTVGATLLWAVAEALAERSTKAAAHSYQEAVAIARLACKAARMVPGPEAWRLRLLGFCLAFLANAWRVAGKNRKAQRLFRRALDLWNRGETGDPERILPEWRLFDLEASVRRDGCEFAAALALLDRAKDAAPEAAWGHILLTRAKTFDAMFEPAQALEVLREASPRIAIDNDPRLRLVALSLECGNLCRIGHYPEAEKALRTAARLASELGNALDLVRLGGLRGRVDAGLGRPKAALESFEAARRHFDEEKMAYDYAVVSLEEAELRLRLGHFDRVQRMVTRDMKWIFDAERIHEGALAALMLFRSAVEGGAVTAELAHRVHHYLERAAYDPTLRFEG